jgi:outer membrane protein assembly factor BamB
MVVTGGAKARKLRAVAGAAVLGAVLAVAGAACSSGPSGQPRHGYPTASPQPGSGSPTGRPVAGGPATGWTSYHDGPSRSGVAAGLPAAGPLAIGWSGRLDGAVYGQPLVLGNLVIAATENDTVYGLDRDTGQVRWLTHVATSAPLSAQPCGDIQPLGITSTMVVYRGLVWAVAQAGRSGHLLLGLDPASGQVRYQRVVPSPDGQPYYDQQRAALAAANGRIYVTFGGHFGDCGPYVGSVVGMPASGTGRIVSYPVPTSTHGGIWAPGGPAIGPGGTLYVGVGNGATRAPFDDTDSVTALTPDLRRTGVFAPANWRADNASDLDLGSMTPALTGHGQILMVGKRGTGYLLSATRLGGVGGQLAQLQVCPAFGSAAVTGSLVIVPCASGGPAAVSVPPARLGVAWRGPGSADGSPVVGGGAVWVTANSGGILYQLDPATGRVLHQIALGSALPHFTSPSLSGRLVLVGTMHGVVAVTGA